MIARGLAQEPKILLLDEPTSSLDIYHQIHVMRMLRDITAEWGIIVMVICHDLNIASRFSDRIIMLAEGGVYVDGTPEEVMTPETVKRVYGVRADVAPVDGRPYVIFHAEESEPGDAEDGQLFEEQSDLPECDHL